jgi:SNF2 family DNA or RNA helicase
MATIQTNIGEYTLFPHQAAAVHWMMDREEDQMMSGGFLCDEMGLGKTISTLGLCANKPVKRTLILCPLPVVKQWIDSIKRLKGPAVYELEESWTYKSGNVLKGRIFVTNYDKLLTRFESFSYGFNRIFCDEAHTLRNEKSSKVSAFRKVPKDFVWFLTGTPVVNSKNDIITLLSLIHKKVSIDKKPTQNQLKRYMSYYALARSTEQLREHLADVLPKPPKIVEHKIPFVTKEESNFYHGIQRRVAAEFDQAMQEANPDMMSVINLLLRLRQASVHPQVYISSMRKKTDGVTYKDWKDHSSKSQKILDIIRAEKSAHGYVIFCNFKEEIDILKEFLEKESCINEVLTYSGEFNKKERDAIIDKTKLCIDENAPLTKSTIDELLFKINPRICENISSIVNDYVGTRHTVLLAQIQCAGTGINLQHFDRVIFTTSWWTAALMDQAVGRVLRLGQKKEVAIHYVWLEQEREHTINIDNYINERVERKRALCKSLLNAANHDLTYGDE